MSYTDKMRTSLRTHGMTRRQYEFIADVLKSQKPGKGSALLAWRSMCDTFATRLAEQRGFDRHRFLRACGYEP